MKKVRFTEDIALNIINSIFENSGLQDFGNDPNLPKEWREKSVLDALNLDFYTFKYRPLATLNIITDLINKGAQSVNMLSALNRAFCLLYLGQIKRVFAKDNDTFEVPVNLEFWIQTSKVKLLEMLVSECNIGLIGNRLTVDFGEEQRKIAIQFGNLNVIDVVTGQPCGEMTAVSCECTMVVSPNISTYQDYSISVNWATNPQNTPVEMPVFSFLAESVATAKGVPYMVNPRTTGIINLSNSKTFTFGFYGFENEFVKHLRKKLLLTTDDSDDNNEVFELSILKDTIEYNSRVVITKHNMSVEPGTGYETHTVTFAVEGMSI